jgi:peptide/nickel transport system substrate-binding protein
MKRHLRMLAAAGALPLALSGADPAFGQKPGGILKMYIWDNPPSMSMLDGVNPLAQRATMGVFNNLIMFDQHVKQSSLELIVPDLATGWSWNEEGTALTLPLRRGVKWHDGKPFTAKDVQCTWDLLLDKSSDKLRVNPLKSWYRNLEEVTTNGDYEITFHLKRLQPAFLMLLANGFAPVYPCHVPARDMDQSGNDRLHRAARSAKRSIRHSRQLHLARTHGYANGPSTRAADRRPAASAPHITTEIQFFDSEVAR